MSSFVDRVQRDLGHIADRATSSPNAWEDIQTRIAERADQPEMEIAMLKPNPKPNRRPQMWVAAAAAAVVVLSGLYLALSGGGDDTPRVTETDDTVVPSPTVAPTTTAENTTTAPPTEVGDAATEVAVAEAFIAARNAYDSDAVLELFADAPSIRDDLLRGEVGEYLRFDEIDYALVVEGERATGVEIVDPECAAASPGRVLCTYTYETAWTRAVGDDRYSGTSLVFDISGGRIDGLTQAFGDIEAVDNHISEVIRAWLLANHPEDTPAMLVAGAWPRWTAESVPLWQSYTEEFVTSVSGL